MNTKTLKEGGTVAELAATVTAFYEDWETFYPCRASFDKIARALGVAVTCTGNSDTAAESVQHTPKKGLSVAFYSVNPSHRTEQEDRPLDAHYIATWKDATYRGRVIMSTGGYHSENPNGFLCFDTYDYAATLPDQCRKMIAEIVTNAVLAAGTNLDQLRREWRDSGTYYDISHYLYKAHDALYEADKAEKKNPTTSEATR